MAVADNYWLGGTTDHENAWATDTNWSLGAKPVVDNTVIIDRDAAYSIDGYDATGALFPALIQEEGSTVSLGSDSAPLLFDATITALAGSGVASIGGSPGTMNLAGAGSIWVRVGATHAAVTISGSPEVVLRSAVTTLIQTGGILTFGDVGFSSVALTTATLSVAARLIYNTTGTLGTLNLKDGGTLDGSGDPRAAIISNLNLYRGGTFIDPAARFTLTNDVVLQEGATLTAE